MSKIPARLFIKLLPPDVTSRHQPADMGMIAALKAGYKALRLHNLLEIFYDPGGYKQAAPRREKQRKRQRGIQHGGNLRILDCIVMIKQVWEGMNGGYVSPEIICHFWRKADILPMTWNQDINNEVGRASISDSQKVVRKEVSDELCNLIAGIKLKANE